MLKIKNKLSAIDLVYYTSILFVVLFFIFSSNYAYALAWKWQLHPGKERILINLNVAGEDKSVKRISPTSVAVDFKYDHDTFNLFDDSPPAPNSLVKSATLQDNQVIIELSSPAFGFLVSKTGPRDFAIDFYPDRLGARWSEKGLLPASEVANIELPVIAKMPEPSPEPILENSVGLTPESTSEISTELSTTNATSAVANTQNASNEAIVEPTTPTITGTNEQTTTPTGPDSLNATSNSTSTQTSPQDDIKIEQTASEVNAMANENQLILPMEDSSTKPENLSISPITEPEQATRTLATPPKSEITSNSIIAKINPNGPEAWPAELGISTVPKSFEIAENETQATDTTSAIEAPQSPSKIETNTNATNTKANPEEPVNEPVREIIYHDEEGNVIPPPPDIPALMLEQRKLVRGQKMSEAYPILEELKGYKLSEADREEVLYNYLATIIPPSVENPEAYFEKVVQAANEAMNFNPLSKRTPEALFQLGMINILVNNLEDAEAYFNLLHQRFPNYKRTPEAFLTLGRKYYNVGRYADVVKVADIIISEYSDSPEIKAAAILEAKSLYKQGHYDRAMTIVDFINKRYPKIHLEDPSYISISADIQFREKRYADSAESYWLQYNLNPNAKDIQDILLRIAEAYYLDNNKNSAATVSEEIINKYPNTEAAAISLLRLGENGIYNDNLNVEELFALFKLDNPRIPDIYYKRIIALSVTTSITPTAKIRSIAWQLSQGDNYAAMQEAQKFITEYPNNIASITAEEIILRAFQNEYKATMEEENFERLLMLWEQFPSVQSRYYPLEPDFRLALARAKLNRGQEAEAIELLNEFIKNTDNFEYSIYAYNIMLAKFLREQNWAEILKLGEQVEAWDLDQATRDQLDYSLALASQNLDLAQKALPKWQHIADNPRFPSYQRAYANYFLTREAERVQDLQKAYTLNLETLALFNELENSLSEYADKERIRESIASLMDITETNGQYAESLEWIARYEEFVPQSSPDYAGLRFREARVYRKMGDLARWKIILDNIITREPDSVFGKMAASELRTQEVAKDISRFN